MSISGLNLQTNVASMNAQRAMARTQGILGKSMERLSSGMRINMAADDAAGLSISEKLRSQIRSLQQASRNANDGVSLLQTAEGGLNEIQDMLTRMRELAVQAANGTLGSSERLALNKEFTLLKAEIDRISATTEFNGTKLIDGSLSAGVTFQVGINNVAANDRIVISLADSDSTALGLSTGVTVSTVTKARGALSLLDTATGSVSSRRGDIGASQNRLYTSINSLASAVENLSAANSRVRDADVAQESASLARAQILMQAGVSVLSQANQLPQLSLALIGR